MFCCSLLPVPLSTLPPRTNVFVTFFVIVIFTNDIQWDIKFMTTSPRGVLKDINFDLKAGKMNNFLMIKMDVPGNLGKVGDPAIRQKKGRNYDATVSYDVTVTTGR